MSTATLSPCGRYRYDLTREIGPASRTACFIMLNPSTADATKDDPTIRKCVGFARRWNCGRLVVVNLFALRATDPREIRRVSLREAIGPNNDFAIVDAADRADVIVCAWGRHGTYHARDEEVLKLLSGDLRALKITKNGQPYHPLYVPYSASLLPFEDTNARAGKTDD